MTHPSFRPIDDYWLPTPDSISEVLVCKTMQIPDNMLSEVYGALDALLDRYNWNETGILTPVQVVDGLLPMVSAFVGSECAVIPPEVPPPLMALVDPYIGYWWTA